MKTHSTNLTGLAPILASILFGAFCAFIIQISSLTFHLVTPFSEDSLGFFASLANGSYFVLLVAIGASSLYLFMKRKKYRLVTMLIKFALTLAIFTLSFFYLSAIFSLFDYVYWDILSAVVAMPVTALIAYALFKTNEKFANAVLVGIGGGLGTFLGFSLPTVSTILVLVFLAIYDSFSVFYGPIGKIARSGLDRLQGLSLSIGDVQIGLGDLTFYSMLSGHMFLNYGLVSCSASIGGILLGCALTFKLLEKKGMIPGLPFPILFGLSAGFLFSLL